MFDSKTATKVADEFAHLKDVVFLNTCVTAVPPKCVQEAYIREMQEFVAGYGSEASWHDENARAREGVARLIGADPDEIAISNNTTTGIGAISMGYPWDKDKNIVVYNREHPANLYDWILRRDEGRLTVKLVDAPPTGLRAQDLIDAIDDNTQAVTVSAVQYGDGAYVDLKKLGQVCKERGILLIVDGIQAMGRMRIDVKEMNISFMACGGHKGMLVRNGVGFIYCRRDLIEKITPPNASYQSIETHTRAYPPFSDETIHWFKDARRFENGNHNHAGVCALIASTGLISEIGIDKIEARIVELQDYLYKALGDDARKMVPVSDKPSGIIRANFDGAKRPQVLEILAKYKVYGTVRPDNLRLCINFFNTESQMDVAARAIKEIFSQCGRAEA
jgi:cysteine desulfurase/selenocysteine lyase